MAKDKGASHRTIAKRPSGPQHVLGSPTKQPKHYATWSNTGRNSGPSPQKSGC